MLKRKGAKDLARRLLLISTRGVLVKLAGSGENGEKETGDSADGVSEEFRDEVIAGGGSRIKRKSVNAHEARKNLHQCAEHRAIKNENQKLEHGW